jgi:tRNA (guanine-N7-)-methyltransferase
VGKDKLKRWAEIKKFDHVIQPVVEDIFEKDHSFKGKWAEKFFNNNYPIVLELGCGKGEYTINLAKKYNKKNFIGIDIKGARIWKGAREVEEMGLKNVCFIRTRIEFINVFFSKDEISEIWITFPDPQSKRKREKKRLTNPWFLNSYKDFLIPEGIIHLKTDNFSLFEYTLDIVRQNNLELLHSTPDLYNTEVTDESLYIKTFYEKQFIEEGKKITCLSFRLTNSGEIKYSVND